MPELRTDWLTGRSVIVAENRAQRPNEFAIGPASGGVHTGNSAVTCPFCAGNEHLTPPSVYEQSGGDGRWQIRVVPNKYPALAHDGTSASTTVCQRSLWADSSGATGAHEVIVESPNHVDRMSALSVEELRKVLEAYAARLSHWQQHGRFKYGLLFKNQGAAAGASLVHVHSQLVALTEAPPPVQREQIRAQTAVHKSGRCPYCQLIDLERSAGERVVIEGNGFIAFCPFASLQPFEAWVMPSDHRAAFEQSAGEGTMPALAGVLQAVVRKVESQLPTAAYNWWIRTAPWHVNDDRSSHWRLELLPRVSPLAGLELAAGVHINPLSPEEAARRLREA
jgi:UDPglucose--hexose-1-phosphate uridylyltransferase